MKLIRVKDCQSCPYEGKCKAWKKLSRDQRVRVILKIRAPLNYILVGCHLEDDPLAETNEKA